MHKFLGFDSKLKLRIQHVEINVLIENNSISSYEKMKAEQSRLVELYLSNSNELISDYSFTLHDLYSGDTFVWRAACDGLPIYWRKKNQNTLCISPAIVNLFCANDYPALDPVGVYKYLRFQYSPAPYTVIMGVKKLPAGSGIKITKSGNLTTFTSSQSIFLNSESKFTEKHCNEMLDHIYKELSQEVKGVSALFCSGGVDSTTNAIRCLEENVNFVLLTAGFNNSELDEVPFAKLVQKYTNTPHRIHQTGFTPVDELEKVISNLAEPICDRALIPTNELIKYHGFDCSHIISGEGGDELWGPPRRWRRDELENCVPENISSLCENHMDRIACLSKSEREKWFLDKDLAKLASQESKELLYKIVEASETKDGFQMLKAIQLVTWLPENVLAKDRAIGRKFDMTVHFPLISPIAQKLIKSMSPSEHWYWCGEKTILKNYMNTVGLNTLTKKRKQKFKVPIKTWLSNDFKNHLIDMISISSYGLSTYLSSNQITLTIDQLLAGRGGNDRAVWGVYVLAVWFDQLRLKIYNAQNI